MIFFNWKRWKLTRAGSHSWSI